MADVERRQFTVAEFVRMGEVGIPVPSATDSVLGRHQQGFVISRPIAIVTWVIQSSRTMASLLALSSTRCPCTGRSGGQERISGDGRFMLNELATKRLAGLWQGPRTGRLVQRWQVPTCAQP